MAGPCLTILLPNKISDMDRIEVENTIQPISTLKEKRDFWVGGQPFIWNEALPDEEESQLNIKGWFPEGVLVFCAMCNNIASHSILAAICIKVAEKTKWNDRIR